MLSWLIYVYGLSDWLRYLLKLNSRNYLYYIFTVHWSSLARCKYALLITDGPLGKLGITVVIGETIVIATIFQVLLHEQLPNCTMTTGDRSKDGGTEDYNVKRGRGVLSSLKRGGGGLGLDVRGRLRTLM